MKRKNTNRLLFLQALVFRERDNMNNKIRIVEKNKRERGAALVTVLMISVLLGIACIAMLSAVGASSQNSTDLLSETKAYYAAESGLQATINVLRGNTDTNTKKISYSKAVNPTTSNYLLDPKTYARLSDWLPYNYSVLGIQERVVVGQTAATYDPKSGTAYSVVVSDPDNTSASVTFSTSGTFDNYVTTTPYTSSATFSADKKKICIPSCPAINPPSSRTEITFTDEPSTPYTFTGFNPSLGTFNIQKYGNVNINRIDFQIVYRVTAPRSGTTVIRGYIQQASPTNPTIVVNFDTQEYKLMGSQIELCSLQTSFPVTDDRCSNVSFSLLPLQMSGTFQLFADITPLEPFRLLVKSTGYGPNAAKKELEAIIKKDLLNGSGSAAVTTMLGTYSTPPGGLPFLFDAGTSSGITYSGGDCASTTGCVPSFGITDPNPDYLRYLIEHPPGPGAGNPAQMQPPPELLSSDIPDWQQSPQALDALIDEYRIKAQISGRYFVNPSGNAQNFNVGSTQNPPGSFAEGTGITFCEGSCKIGSNGGGTLVVTGKLTNVGSFSFKGLIIVTGEEGWERDGTGSGGIIGNIVIAPYNRRNYVPENLSSTFLAPRYSVSGGGSSTVSYNDVSAPFDVNSTVGNFMLGIAEK